MDVRHPRSSRKVKSGPLELMSGMNSAEALCQEQIWETQSPAYPFCVGDKR